MVESLQANCESSPRKELRFSLLILIFVSVSGCNTIKTEPPTRMVGQYPVLNTAAQVGVGEAVYTEYDYLGYSHGVVSATSDFTWKQLTATVEIKIGDKLKCSQAACCTTEPKYRVSWPKETRIVCFSDEDDDFIFEKMQIQGFYRGLKSNLSYEPVSSGVTAGQVVDGFKQELLYNGVAAGVLSITYREYKNDFARAAFFQDAKYDFTPGMTISFKGAKIVVEDADPEGLKYEVVQGFTSR